MIEELAGARTARLDLVTRALTPIIKGSGQRMLRWKPARSVLVELPNGQRIRFGRRSERNEPLLKLHNYRVIAKSLRRGAIGFAESYLDGDIECSDLTKLFRFFVRNRDRLDETGGALFKSRLPDRIAHLARANTPRGSRRNISEHYDLGNDFYRHWLDAEMNYSSGLYAGGEETLEQAQEAKLDLVIDMLDLKGGEHILEIGCGWGAFARRAARTQEASVTGLTLSLEQQALARDRAHAEGLNSQCDFRLQDYRDMEGRFDRIVSIEMIEAVGEENWPRYFSVLHDRLKPGGCAVIQSITIEERRFRKYRKKADFIQRYIFPGGMLPTPGRIESHAAKVGLAVERTATFGLSYARTLKEWRLRFERAWPQIAGLGFDERFRRKWNYYLAYCEAGFLEGVIDVQVYRLRRA
jgi:cyclopropane-fatty-acyl-phospholipid synthase